MQCKLHVMNHNSNLSPHVPLLLPSLVSVSVLGEGEEVASAAAEIVVASLGGKVFVALVKNVFFPVVVSAPTARSPRCRASRCPRGGTGPSCSRS